MGRKLPLGLRILPDFHNPPCSCFVPPALAGGHVDKTRPHDQRPDPLRPEVDDRMWAVWKHEHHGSGRVGSDRCTHAAKRSAASAPVQSVPGPRRQASLGELMPKHPRMPERPPSFDHCSECGKIVGDFGGWFGPQCMCALPPGDALRGAPGAGTGTKTR